MYHVPEPASWEYAFNRASPSVADHNLHTETVNNQCSTPLPVIPEEFRRQVQHQLHSHQQQLFRVECAIASMQSSLAYLTERIKTFEKYDVPTNSATNYNYTQEHVQQQQQSVQQPNVLHKSRNLIPQTHQYEHGTNKQTNTHNGITDSSNEHKRRIRRVM